MVDSGRWLEHLHATLPRHADALRALTAAMRTDPRIVLFMVACSVGRGTADALSDIDCAVCVEPDSWPAIEERVVAMVRSLGTVVDLLSHTQTPADLSRRLAVQFDDGLQLDLLLSSVEAWSGMHPADTVVLYAKRPVFTRPWDPASARPDLDKLREWCFLGWWALLDADKYLRRGSLWEAMARLDEARLSAWRLAATAAGLSSPEYGVTAVLDGPDAVVPRGMEATVARLDAAEIRAAMGGCGELLDALWPAAAAATAVGGSEPPPIAAWTTRRLGGFSSVP